MGDYRAEEKSGRYSGHESEARGRRLRPREGDHVRDRKTDGVAELRNENARLQEELSRLRGAIAEHQALHDAAPFASLRLDRVGHIVHLNETAAAMLGEPRGQIVGKPLVSFFSRESRNKVFMLLHACWSEAGKAEAVAWLCSDGLPAREVRLAGATVRKDSGQRLCHVVMLQPIPGETQDVAGDAHSVRQLTRDLLFPALSAPLRMKQLARAVRVLESQAHQLEAQNQYLTETQRLLEESRDRYAMLYEFSPISYITLDELGCIRVLNLTAAVMLGAERSHIAGQPFAHYIDSNDVSRLEAHLDQCGSGVPLVRTEVKLQTRHGVRVIELISVQPGSETEGRFYRTALMDVTERKRATESLHESEAKLRWLIDNMPAVLWIRDEHGSPRYVSANISSVLGYAEHEIRSGGARFWFENIHPDDRERVKTAYRRMFDTRESGGPGAYDIEYRRLTRDGNWVWVVDRGMSVTEEGGVRYATGIFWDTTRRKRMQEQLRESEERFRQLAENIDDVFFLTDVRGNRIYYVSPTFQRLWGYSADKLYRDPASWIELVHEADRRRVRRIVRARRPDAPYDAEFRIRHPDGAVRWIRLRGFPIRDMSGEVRRFAGIAVDVTARREAAEMLQRSHQQMRALAVHLQAAREEERKRIAREIHDELGALLLAIKMDAEACRKKGSFSNGERSGILEQLVGRIDAALDSVRRIATDLRPSILDHLGVLAAVEWEAQDLERRTGIECVVETDPGKEDLDIAPEPATALFRIVQEALANVVRHSGATRVRIALREESGAVKLQITDNGKGIDFEARPEGRRWGLVGMAERVSAFNGQFGVDRVKPHGTIVTAVIPAQSAGVKPELRPRV